MTTMTKWEKGRPARERYAARLRVQMDECIANVEAGIDVKANAEKFRELQFTAKSYITRKDGRGEYGRRFMAALMNYQEKNNGKLW